MKKIALFGFVTVLTISAFQTEPSLANYICPNGPGAGEVQVGLTNGGSGVANVPVCEQSGGGEQAPQQQETSLPWRPWSPEALAALRAEVKRDRAVREAIRQYPEMMRKPFKNLPKNGGWGFGQGTGFCEARFGSRDGIITIFQYATSRGPSQAFAKGSGLSFIGFGIPTPKTEKRVHVMFEEAGAPPQTVDAIYGPFGSVIGNLTIRDTPMTKDGFESMPDKADFRISIDGNQIFTMGWRDGAKAREKLRQCTASGVAARGSR